MWIIRNKKDMFNINCIDEIKVVNCNIVFIKNENAFTIPHETEAEAVQHFNYIIDGIKAKQGVIHI